MDASCIVWPAKHIQTAPRSMPADRTEAAARALLNKKRGRDGCRGRE
eukprot:gene1384-1139_t